MRVLKFGGTSVGSPESIGKVIEILKDYRLRGLESALVVSAMGGVTNKLIATAGMASKGDTSYETSLKEIETRHFEVIKELIDVKLQSKVFANTKMLLNQLEDILNGVCLLREISVRSMDLIMSFGERLSASIIAECFKSQDIDAEFADARTFIRTNKKFGNAAVDFDASNKLIKEYFRQHKALQIVTGFIAATSDGDTTTMGRGGSDYTAAIVGAALGAEEIEIWTDVDGMMTADPRIVKKAFPLTDASYIEAMELSHFGAKVIYPPTLQPVVKEDIPIRIKNTFNPEFEGTLISKEGGRGVRFPIKGISSIKEICLLNVQGNGMVGERGVSGRLFSALAGAGINIILITQASSEHSICFATEPTEGDRAVEIIKKEFEFEFLTSKIEQVQVEYNLSIVAIVGENMKHTPGISGRLFGSLGKNGINVVAIAQGSSEFNLSVVIEQKNLSKALNALHESFFQTETKTVNVFSVGLGWIGGTLLKQIKAHSSFLNENNNTKIRVRAIANSRKMLFAEEDVLEDENYLETLQTAGEPTDIKKFIATMMEMNLVNSVFVDNTANKELVKYYPQILGRAISIVTPNKVANSGSYAEYVNMLKLAEKNNVKYLYETNVGAGLPIISTMRDLMNSGDRFIKIEAVLSGTLSFIFNSFKAGIRFSDVVKQAKAKGFTEPDPRDDLNGMDVMRKILILAREAGTATEPEQVEVENILPQACRDARSVDDFFVELEKADGYFDGLRQQAESEGKILRYIAALENGKASVKLTSVGPEHPFYSMSGSDNIISFTTERYIERPLVVKGPGAGAEVTAAGVFADIVKVSNYLS